MRNLRGASTPGAPLPLHPAPPKAAGLVNDHLVGCFCHPDAPAAAAGVVE